MRFVGQNPPPLRNTTSLMFARRFALFSFCYAQLLDAMFNEGPEPEVRTFARDDAAARVASAVRGDALR
jgi:hypothetical protein